MIRSAVIWGVLALLLPLGAEAGGRASLAEKGYSLGVVKWLVNQGVGRRATWCPESLPLPGDRLYTAFTNVPLEDVKLQRRAGKLCFTGTLSGECFRRPPVIIGCAFGSAWQTEQDKASNPPLPYSCTWRAPASLRTVLEAAFRRKGVLDVKFENVSFGTRH